MTDIVDLHKARLEIAARRGYRNWKSHFQEDFALDACLTGISSATLVQLAEGRDRSTFYILDFIMNLRNLGSGLEFHELPPKEKMSVMDCYLFLLDRIRFEWMKRLGWLEEYPGEEYALVELVLQFDDLAPRLQACAPALSKAHPSYDSFRGMNAFEREELIRKLIPDALRQIQDHSSTL